MPSQKLLAVSRTFFTYAAAAPGVWVEIWVSAISDQAFELGGPGGSELHPGGGVEDAGSKAGWGRRHGQNQLHSSPITSEVEFVAGVADVLQGEHPEPGDADGAAGG